MPDRWFKHVLVLIALAGPALPVPAQNCVEDAHRAYSNMRLPETIHLLEACRGRGWPDIGTRAQKAAAFRLLAISYYETGRPDSTMESVRLLLREDRGYKASVEDDPLYFQQMVDRLRPRAWHQKRWVRFGGAAVLGGVVGVALTWKTDPEPLPGPPLPDAN